MSSITSTAWATTAEYSLCQVLWATRAGPPPRTMEGRRFGVLHADVASVDVHVRNAVPSLFGKTLSKVGEVDHFR